MLQVLKTQDRMAALTDMPGLEPDSLLLHKVQGFDAVRAQGETRPSVRVLVVSQSADFELLVEALQAGAIGFIWSDSRAAEVQQTNSDALAGGPRTKRTPRPLLGAGRRQVTANPLSPRESEVLRLLVRGYSNREIADDLVITAHTAKVHVEHILAKLHVRGRTEAAVRAVECGYVTV